MNKLCFVINKKGERITSCVDNSTTDNELLSQTKERFPGYSQYLIGDDDMLDQFLSGKIYKEGKFVDPPVIEYIPTKAEKIAYIKKYYDTRFATLDQALIRRRLINGDITDLQEQFKKLNTEMLAKIKEIQ